jgi:vacuolar-type H+-ATPase subunit I/STV1
MAVISMAKIMIVTHRSQASELLEALQHEGICQILNAEEAMVSKDWPELATTAQRPREIEGFLTRLTKSIAFLSKHAETKGGLASLLAPRAVVDRQVYDRGPRDFGFDRRVRADREND